jgi:hypothetical protein
MLCLAISIKGFIILISIVHKDEETKKSENYLEGTASGLRNIFYSTILKIRKDVG